ncbi:MAG: hypothetical protein AAGD92_14035 [Pseudomonadota bacterium]
MLTLAMKSVAALAAAAGLAYTAAEDAPLGSPYDESALKVLTEAQIADHASLVFARADFDQDGKMNADEFAALSIVTAELALLNGFIVIENADDPGTVALGETTPQALSPAEHVRIEAVARNVFYHHAGEDGELSEDEFIASERAKFAAADLNNNGALRRGELRIFAQRQANLSVGA